MNRDKFIATFFEFAKWLRKHDFTPLFILQDPADDMPLGKLIAENGFQGIIPNTAREAVSIYSRCSFVVGMRGHSLILAVGQGVPMLAISYNKKVDAFMDLADMKDYCIHQDKIDNVNDLISHFEKLVDQKSAVASHLEIKKDEFKEMVIDYTQKVVTVFKIDQY